MAIKPEDVGIDDQPELDPIYLREPDNPKYQIMFPWGAGGNIVRHLIALHPGQEYLNIAGERLTDPTEKFQDLIENQYPSNRVASSWLAVEWATRHLYNESRIAHHPPGSWHGLPTIIINPDRPDIVSILYQIKNPGMNGWELSELITYTKNFGADITREKMKYRKCLILNFSDLISDFNSAWYHKIVYFLELETSADIESMAKQVHNSWLWLQRQIWSNYFK